MPLLARIASTRVLSAAASDAHAAMRADELLREGDVEGSAVWRSILRTIKELLAKERPEDENLH